MYIIYQLLTISGASSKRFIIHFAFCIKLFLTFLKTLRTIKCQYKRINPKQPKKINNEIAKKPILVPPGEERPINNQKLTMDIKTKEPITLPSNKADSPINLITKFKLRIN